MTTVTVTLRYVAFPLYLVPCVPEMCVGPPHVVRRDVALRFRRERRRGAPPLLHRLPASPCYPSRGDDAPLPPPAARTIATLRGWVREEGGGEEVPPPTVTRRTLRGPVPCTCLLEPERDDGLV